MTSHLWTRVWRVYISITRNDVAGSIWYINFLYWGSFTLISRVATPVWYIDYENMVHIYYVIFLSINKILSNEIFRYLVHLSTLIRKNSFFTQCSWPWWWRCERTWEQGNRPLFLLLTALSELAGAVLKSSPWSWGQGRADRPRNLATTQTQNQDSGLAYSIIHSTYDLLTHVKE